MITQVCCPINTDVGTTDFCGLKKPGISDIRFACLTSIASYTLSASPDFQVSAITMNSTDVFRRGFIKTNTGQHQGGRSYSEESATNTDTMTINFGLEYLPYAVRLSLRNWVGKEIVAIWKDNDTGEYYAGGLDGGLRFASYVSDSGTTEKIPTAVTLSGATMTELEYQIFSVDAATTLALIDAISA